jgi:hypothetical protein
MKTWRELGHFREEEVRVCDEHNAVDTTKTKLANICFYLVNRTMHIL